MKSTGLHYSAHLAKFQPHVDRESIRAGGQKGLKNNSCIVLSNLRYLLKLIGNPPKANKKSRIRETKNLSTDADISTNNKKNPASKAKLAKKTNFFLRGNCTPSFV